MKRFSLSLLAFFTIASSQKNISQGNESPVAPDSSKTAGVQNADTRESSPIRWYTMFENIPRDWSRWADVSFRKDKAGEWAAVGALTAVLILTDDDTYSPSERFYKSSGAGKYWSDFFAAMGDGRTQFGLAGAFAAYGLVLSDQRALRTGTEIVEVVLASGGVVQVLKHITGRESPFVRSKPLGRWSFFPNQIDYHRYVPYFDAFPSGHICTSLGTVIVIAENYPDTPWIRPLGYVLTTLVGIGMGTNGIHWYSDYPLGLLLGYYFGMIAAHPEGFPLNEASNSTSMSVLPLLFPDGVGVSLTLSF